MQSSPSSESRTEFGGGKREPRLPGRAPEPSNSAAERTAACHRKLALLSNRGTNKDQIPQHHTPRQRRSCRSSFAEKLPDRSPEGADQEIRLRECWYR